MLEPVLDESRLREARRLAELIYRLHEAGQPYEQDLALLAKTTGQELTKSEVCGAFGSLAPEDWAHLLVLEDQALPTDLSRSELVEMVRRLCEVSGPEWLLHWYLRCLEHATGCDAITDMLDSPEDLAPEEVLEQAFRSKRRVLITPPPTEGS
jgi:hypothetical protein